MAKENVKVLFTWGQKPLIIVLIACFATTLNAQPPLRVVVAGLSHDHVHGILSQYNKGVVDIVGIAEANKQLQQKYSKLYNIPDSLFFTDLKKLVTQKKPDAVSSLSLEKGEAGSAGGSSSWRCFSFAKIEGPLSSGVASLSRRKPVLLRVGDCQL